MKIKQIKFNGIRGFSFWKDDNNNPNPHLVNLEGKHLFIYGENGSGKSSFFDSLEWCLTGSSPECKNRRIDSQEDFLKNAFNADIDIPSVEVSFDTAGGDVFIRESKRGVRQAAFAYESEAEINFIESSRIEKFVIDTPRSLWERFLILLGLDELIQFRTQQRALKTEAKRDLDKAEESFSNSERTVNLLKNEIAELEKKLQGALGIGWKNNLGDSKLSESEKLYKQFATLEKAAKDLSEKFTSFSLLQVQKSETVSSLETEKGKTETPKVAGVINEAYNYFNSVDNVKTCPVCENPVKQKDVLQRLKALKDAYSNIIGLEARLKEIEGQIISQKQEVAKAKSIFITEYCECYIVDLSQKTDEELATFLSTELAEITGKKEDYFSSIKNS